MLRTTGETFNNRDGGANTTAHMLPKHAPCMTYAQVLKGQRCFSTPLLWKAGQHMG